MKPTRQAKAPARPKFVKEARVIAEECLCWNARLFARRITAHFEAHMADAELTIAQFGLMALIAGSEDDTLAALAERAGLDPSTLSRNLQTLERDGLIEIVASEDDQRRRAVCLTETGARKLAAALPHWREAQVKAEARLKADLVRRLVKQSSALEGDE